MVITHKRRLASDGNKMKLLFFFTLFVAMLIWCFWNTHFLLYLTDTLYDVARHWPSLKCVWDRRNRLFFLHLSAQSELSLRLRRSVKLFLWFLRSIWWNYKNTSRHLFFFFFFLTAKTGHHKMNFCINTKNIWKAVVIARVSNRPISVLPLCIPRVPLPDTMFPPSFFCLFLSLDAMLLARKVS